MERSCGPTSDRRAEAEKIQGLYPYQVEAVNWALAREGRVLLAHDMGLGKTVTALALMKHYRSEWPLLILAPKAVLTQWEQEVKRWVGEQTFIQVIRKGKDTYLEDLEVAIVTYDIFAKNSHLHNRPDGESWDVIILDESHKCKNPKTKRTQGVMPIVLRANRCALLSGTPMTSSAADLWPQLRMVMNSRARMALPSFREWQRHYCIPREVFTGKRTIINWTSVKPERERELQRVLGFVKVRKMKSEVASQLPRKMVTRLYMNASPAIRRRVKKRFDTFQKMSEQTRLVIEGNDEERPPTHKVMKLFRENALDRVDGAIEWIKETFLEEGNRKKVIVFAHHRDVMDKLERKICDVLKAPFVRVDGSTSEKRRREKIMRFKSDGRCQIGLFSIGSCGTGLNLTEATTVLFAEMHWSQSLHAQAEDRIHRINQREPCNILYAMFSESLDEIIYGKLQKTKRITEFVVDGPKKNLKRKRSD